ncbi:Serine carboxypeptidase-like 31 [Camellia lanceoleosa]|uniref:Serine carboxypeptidase-like 31 n=1 Tax=Camellia lanceoleosa TaxID=1840588 RepID=A0ACC0GH84_9ERIC|nr:Serine carboxypeptidase-like 31 [Camellia lanceoleosa]
MDFVVKLMFTLILALIASLYMEPVVGARSDWQCSNKYNKLNLLEYGDLVINLPGQPKVDFQHHAGYVTVDEKNGRALFYWFYEASTLPDEKPLVLWLNGGPGCSSVGYGATQEIGPFIVDTDGHPLKLNPYAWNTEANMLFLESPVGVGFSYSNTTTDYDNLGDDFTANDAYTFLHKWFLKFPSYRSRIFYVAGESYAGKYVPELAELILDKNKDPTLLINLKGILLGNPETCDAEDWKGLVDYAWSHAVVSDETHETIRMSCDFNSNNTWSNNDCCQAVDEVLRQYKEIDIYSLYTSVCIGNSTSSGGSEQTSLQVMFRSTSKMMPRIMGGYDPCLDEYATTYYNRPDVQKALHVSNGDHLKNWSICNMKIFDDWSDSKESVLPIYKKLIAAGLRIWVYSGDTDGRVPVLSTRYSLSSLGLPITRAWRPWYHKKQVGGWLQEYEGLTFATFRGAGHAVPIFKPSESLAFFSSFLRGESPPFKRY